MIPRAREAPRYHSYSMLLDSRYGHPFVSWSVYATLTVRQDLPVTRLIRTGGGAAHNQFLVFLNASGQFGGGERPNALVVNGVAAQNPRAMKAPPKKRATRLVSIGLLAAGLLALPFIPGLRPRDFLAAHWKSAIPTLPDSQVLPTLRQLADLGDDQIDYLVSQLGSDEERIARDAWQVLDERMTRWQLLKTKESSPKVAMLASSLARRVSTFRGESKRFASDLAAKALVWPTNRQEVDTTRLIADCDTILREASRKDLTSKRSTAVQQHASVGTYLGNREPGAPVVEPALPPPLDRATAKARRQGEPGIFKAPADEGPATDKDSIARPAKALIGDDAHVDASSSYVASPDEWAERTTLEVIKLLQSKNVLEASQAAMEFRRRGFGEVHLRFAEQLTAPDPQVRRKFAESLPLVSDTDVRPWLVWLSHDEDADVRLAAVSIMATRDDPEFRKRLRQLELEESNPAVLKQVQRSLR